MTKALYEKQPISLIIICVYNIQHVVVPYKNISELMLFYHIQCIDYFAFVLLHFLPTQTEC